MSEIVFKEITFKNVKRNTYFISEDGQVYSKIHNKILKWKIDNKGYAFVRLSIDDDENIYNKDFSIASLVMDTYVGVPPTNMKDPTIDHINNKKLDNNYKNLQWLERIDNCSKITPNCTLTEEQVHNICKLIENGNNCNKISKMYGVTPMTIYKIKQHKTWKHISCKYNI